MNIRSQSNIAAAADRAGPPVVRDAAVPERLWVPCAAEPKPIGTRVARAEPLSLDAGSCPAPAAGRIAGTKDVVLLGGSNVRAVVLETDSTPVPAPPLSADRATVRRVLGELGPEQAEGSIAKLVASGVAADRWCSPDLPAQLRRLCDRKVKTVVCGALDLDPALPIQQTLVLHDTLELAAGAAALGRLAGAERVFVAVPENIPSAGVAALRSAAEATGVRLYPLPCEYPLAHPSVLIERITRRRLKPDLLPPEVGVLMLDAPAALAVGRCFLHGEPMLRVPLAVYDRPGARAHLLRVSIGARLADVLRGEGISKAGRVLQPGHVLRDLSADANDVIGPAELTLFLSDPPQPADPAACLRCGWCVEACPVQIHPASLLDASQQHDPELARRNGLASCIECGICSYVCPSRLPLLSAIRALRRST